MRTISAITLGVLAAVTRYIRLQSGIRDQRYNACVCVDFVTMKPQEDCGTCFGSGLHPKEEYQDVGVLRSYHMYESPLRHLKPRMTTEDQRVYDNATRQRWDLPHHGRWDGTSFGAEKI